MQYVLIIAILVGLFLIFVKTLWPFLLIGALLWAGIRGYQHLEDANTPEGQRWREMRRRGEEKHFRTDEELRHHADDAYQDYLDGQDDGGLPPFDR